MWFCRGDELRSRPSCSLNANYPCFLGFPSVSVTKSLLPVQEAQEIRVQSRDGEDPLEEEMTARQYSCLENPMDSGALRTSASGVTKSQPRRGQLSTKPPGYPFQTTAEAGGATGQGSEKPSKKVFTCSPEIDLNPTSWQPWIVKAARPFQWLSMPSRDL